MKFSPKIDSKLMADAKQITGIQDESILIEKALELLIKVESQKERGKLKGKAEFDKNPFK